MIDINIIIFVGLSFFMLFLFFYIIKRDKEIEQKFAAIESSLEEINKEIFFIKKSSDSKELIDSVEKIENIIESIVDDIKFMEEKNKEFYKKVEEELATIKIKSKKSEINALSNLNKHEESRILTLYKNGYSIEEISKELRIPIGEVKLIVDISKMHKT